VSFRDFRSTLFYISYISVRLARCDVFSPSTTNKGTIDRAISYRKCLSLSLVVVGAHLSSPSYRRLCSLGRFEILIFCLVSFLLIAFLFLRSLSLTFFSHVLPSFFDIASLLFDLTLGAVPSLYAIAILPRLQASLSGSSWRKT
jgi:hypothetical protein